MSSPLLCTTYEEGNMVSIGGDEEEKELRETILAGMKSGKRCPKNIADIIHLKYAALSKPIVSPTKPSKKRPPPPLKLEIEIEPDPDETQPWGTCDRIEPSQKRACKK